MSRAILFSHLVHCRLMAALRFVRWDMIPQYHCSGDALAASWRKVFNATTAPWFIVQLAPCCGNNFGLDAGDNIREAQRRSSTTVPDAHLVVLNDLGDTGGSSKCKPDPVTGRCKDQTKTGPWHCIDPANPRPPAPQTHPKNKTEAGRRLGLQLWARLFAKDNKTAGGVVQFTGPVLDAVKLVGRNLTVAFEPSSAKGLGWAPTHNCTCYARSCCRLVLSHALLQHADIRSVAATIYSVLPIIELFLSSCSAETQYMQLSNLSLAANPSWVEHNDTIDDSWINVTATIGPTHGHD